MILKVQFFFSLHQKANIHPSYRMAQTTQWSPAILDYMKNVMSNISMCLA